VARNRKREKVETPSLTTSVLVIGNVRNKMSALGWEIVDRKGGLSFAVCPIRGRRESWVPFEIVVYSRGPCRKWA
jgi:hypothetical protein